jgi:hypothetical protein
MRLVVGVPESFDECLEMQKQGSSGGLSGASVGSKTTRVGAIWVWSKQLGWMEGFAESRGRYCYVYDSTVMVVVRILQ